MKQRGFSLIILLVAVAILAAGGYFFLWPKIKGMIEPKTQKVYNIGVLSGLGFLADTTDGFKVKMTELGYIEGKDIFYDIQKTEFDMTAYRSIVKKFVADKVDLIFVFPTEASQEAKSAVQGTSIPVVFANAFTEDTNLVASIREPGGNITGVRWAGPDIALQHFEIMRELVPNAKKMWVPYQKGYPIVKSQLEALRPAFEKAGITLTEVPADNAKELEASFKENAKSGIPDAILMIPEPLCVTPDPFMVIAKFASEHNIPLGGTLVSAGGYNTVFGVIPRGISVGKQAAILADKVLKGTPAGTIPVVSAESYFQLNYKEAKRLRLNVSEALLNRAHEVIR